MAESFQERNIELLVHIDQSEKPCYTLPSKIEKTFYSEEPPLMKDARTFGEVYLCNEQTFGEFFRVQEFDTFKIEKFQGTENKLFVFFQDEEDNNRIAIIEKNGIEKGEDKRIDWSKAIKYLDLDGIGKIIKIKVAKSSLVILSDEGKVYSVDLEGQDISIKESPTIPKLIKFPHRLSIKNISCGWSHSVALTTNGDLYSWGRGSEGQLGNPLIKYCTYPKNINFFNKSKYVPNKISSNKIFQMNIPKENADPQKPCLNSLKQSLAGSFMIVRKVRKIFAACNHNFALTEDKEVFAWGDNSLSVLGVEDKIISLPQEVKFGFSDHLVSEERKLESIFPKKMLSPIHKVKQHSLDIALQIKTLSTCQTHTFFLSENGRVFCCGLDKGQLGITDKNLYINSKSSKTCKFIRSPTEITEDNNGRLLKKFKKIKTSFNKNIGLTNAGEVFVWGIGPLGTGNVKKIKKPSFLKLSSMPIRPTKLIASGSSFAMFVPCKFTSLNPKISFSQGGTLCNIIGFGIIENLKKPLLRLRIEQQETVITKVVPLIYEDSLPSYFFETPYFCEKEISFPVQAQLEISLDGVHFMRTSLLLTILDSKVKLREIAPKFLSYKGGQELSMRLDFNKIFGNNLNSKMVNQKKNSRIVSKVYPELESNLSNILKENYGNLMIAFKQITKSGPTPNFKNLGNNSVIDNDLFLRQKMVISNQHTRKDEMLEQNNRFNRQSHTSNTPDHKNRVSKKNSHFKSNMSIASQAQSMNHNLTLLKKTHLNKVGINSKRSFKESRMGELGVSDDQADESSGWKLIEAGFKEGIVSCKVPEIDIETGKLIMFDRQGIMNKIKENDFNSAGKNLLNEVTQWLNNKSQAKERNNFSNDSTLNDIKKMFNSSCNKGDKVQLEKNKELFGFDLTLNHQHSINEKVLDSIEKEDRATDSIYGFFNFWVDLCLNGQQILGRPFKLTFYKINIESLTPNNCLNEGSIPIYFQGKGIFESDFQKVKIKKGNCERVVDPKWDAVGKRMFFYMPPFEWLQTSSQKNQEIPSQEFMINCVTKKALVFDQLNQKDNNKEVSHNEVQANHHNSVKETIEQKEFDIYLSLSAGDWIFSGKVTYFEPIIDSFLFAAVDEEEVGSFMAGLKQLKSWEFYEDFFGTDFVPFDMKSRSIINFDEYSSSDQETLKPAKDQSKLSQKSKHKSKTEKPKDTKKHFEASLQAIENGLASPGDFVFLISRSGFVKPQDKESLSIKFKFQKHSASGSVWWCNPHMLLAQVPELPYSKPRPVVVEEIEDATDSKASEGKAKKKKKTKPKDEYIPFDINPVGVQLSFNAIQFGVESECKLNFMMFDSEVTPEERAPYRAQAKKGKKKGNNK